MKVLLLKDVYKLGRAGDVKKVADGFGRNFLLPQNLAMLASPGALKQVEHIRAKAAASRSILNEEMSGVAELLKDLQLTFTSKAGETGKLYGSITTQMITDELNKRTGASIDRHQVECQPIRNLGEHKAVVRLTIDLNPEIVVLVYREGEAPGEKPEVKSKVSAKSKAIASEPEPPDKSEEAEQAEESETANAESEDR